MIAVLLMARGVMNDAVVDAAVELADRIGHDGGHHGARVLPIFLRCSAWYDFSFRAL
jgi:hypothetical protein